MSFFSLFFFSVGVKHTTLLFSLFFFLVSCGSLNLSSVPFFLHLFYGMHWDGFIICYCLYIVIRLTAFLSSFMGYFQLAPHCCLYDISFSTS